MMLSFRDVRSQRRERRGICFPQEGAPHNTLFEGRLEPAPERSEWTESKGSRAANRGPQHAAIFA